MARFSFYPYLKSSMNLKKNVKFKIGSENWEMPLGVLILLIFITLLLMIGGAFLGYKFGEI